MIIDLLCGVFLAGSGCVHLNFYWEFYSPSTFLNHVQHSLSLPSCIVIQSWNTSYRPGVLGTANQASEYISQFQLSSSTFLWLKFVSILLKGSLLACTALISNHLYRLHCVLDLNEVPWAVKISFRTLTWQITWNSTSAVLLPDTPELMHGYIVILTGLMGNSFKDDPNKKERA